MRDVFWLRERSFNLQVSDIGADAVFEDPEQRSNRVGITVYNVSVTDLEDFGGLEAVGEQLLAAGAASLPPMLGAWLLQMLHVGVGVS